MEKAEKIISIIANILVIITLSGFSIYIMDQYTKRKEQEKDINRIIPELKINRTKVQALNKYFENVNKEQPNTRHQETIIDIPCFEYEESAFAVLKTSGNIREITDNQATEIWQIYTGMEQLKCHFNWYIKVKRDLYFEYIIKPDQPNVKAFKNKLMSLDQGFSLAKITEEIENKIDTLIKKLEHK